MSWTVFLIASWTVLALTVYEAVRLAGRHTHRRVGTPLQLCFAGILVASLLCLIPVYAAEVEQGPFHGPKTLLFALHHTLQIFTLDADMGLLNELKAPTPWLRTAYSTYLSVLFLAGPVLTFGFIVSFFKNISAYGQYLRHYFADVYVFSELNGRSLTLAADLKARHPRALIVFTGLGGIGEEAGEWLEQARSLETVCFQKDMTAIRFALHSKKAAFTFFAIGEKEAENVNQALRLIENCALRARLYVFCTGPESELLLGKAGSSRFSVHRVNDVRSLINRSLYTDGHLLFEHAQTTAEGPKEIAAMIVGLGRFGTEMLKALAWYCQMDGYRVRIDAFDRDPLAEDRLAAQCPELLSPRYNGVFVPGEAQYTIRVHGGVETDTKTFADAVAALRSVTYVLVALGSDEENIRTAIQLRVIFERMRIRPVIQAIVFDPEKRGALDGVTNFRNQEYGISLIGDVVSSYTEDVVLNSELERRALQAHLKWGEEEDFWKYEYNYRSSIALVIHIQARIACGIPGADKKEAELTDAERTAIERIEHRRWNAYMRSEGYVFSGSTDKSSRNDLGKMHHDLVDYERLDENEKRKDSRVGTG